MKDQAMKLSEYVLEDSIRDMVDIYGMQFGFLSGRGTADAIFIVRQIQVKYIARKILYILHLLILRRLLSVFQGMSSGEP